MKTRALETKEVLRAAVERVEVLAITDATVFLKTFATVSSLREFSSADGEMLNQHKLTAVGETVEGRVRIDVPADSVLRVRYAEGEEVPVNDTAMLVGAPAGPLSCAIQAADDAVVIRTARMVATISLDPYRIEIRDLQDRKICGVGGREKDNFHRWDSCNTGICRLRADGSPLAVESFDLAGDEAIYGFGEQFIKLNKVGQTIDLELQDAMGVTTPRSYKNIPFFVSTGGYGVFFNHSSLMTCWVGSMSAVDVQLAAADDFLDYYLLVGDIKEVLASYTALTGRGALPPKWSFGYWQSKISYGSAAETLEVARQLRAHEIPCDVICLDTDWYKQDWFCDLEFDAEDFPDPRGFFQQMAGLNFNISLWQLPYIPQGSKLFDDLQAVNGFVKNADGDIYDCHLCFTDGFKGIVGVIDYTNPAAVRVHLDALRRLFRLGAKVIKTDFGEGAPLDGVYHDGTPGHQMHNLYPLLYNRAVFEMTKEETGAGIVWARSAWAGNQRYPLHWGGDSSPNFANMLPQLVGGLSFGLSGFQFWSQDIGGFLGDTGGRLLIRWLQWSMFLSHSRIHGPGDRELYKFSPEVLGICRDYIRLRYRLLPYSYGMAWRCVEQSLPMARALVVEYQQDPTVWHIDDEFLCGDSLLVAPVYTAEDHRRLYLPAGLWTDWWSGERLPGNRWIEVTPNLATLPLYLREGAIVPLGPVMNYVDEFPTEQITLRVALFAGDGRNEFTVPVNDEWVPVSYVAANGNHRITIGASKVEFTVEALGEGEVVVERG